MQKRSRFTAVFLVLGLLLCFGAGVYFGRGATPVAGEAESFTTEVVTKGDIEDVVTAQGKLEPAEYVDVGAQVSGQLEKIHVEIGDVVKTGDLIAEIDPEIYEAQVQADDARLKTLEAQMAQQEAQVIQAQQKFDRNEKLMKSKAVSEEIFEDTRTALKIADAQKAALAAQIEEARSARDATSANLSYTKIYAPMDGTVVSQTAREGQTLNANQSAPVIIQIAQLELMTVRAQVAEADVMRITEDMPVYFTTLGSSGRQWNGKVRQILPSPEVINDVVLYNVLVDVENEDRQLMTGMSTQMFFVLAEAKDVPVIPVAALGKRLKDKDSDLGTAYEVRVVKGRSVTEKTVHIGLMDRTFAEVKSGLAVGDKVAIAAPKTDAQNQNRPPRGMGGPRL